MRRHILAVIPGRAPAKRREGKGTQVSAPSGFQTESLGLSFAAHSAETRERNHLGPLPSPRTRCVQGSPGMTIDALVVFWPAYPRPLLANFRSFSTVYEISAANLSPHANPRLSLRHECACEQFRYFHSRHRGGDGTCAPSPSPEAKGGGGWRRASGQLSCRSVRSRYCSAEARWRPHRQSQCLASWRPLGRPCGTAPRVPRLLPRGESARRSRRLDDTCGHRPLGPSRFSDRRMPLLRLRAKVQGVAGGVP